MSYKHIHIASGLSVNSEIRPNNVNGISSQAIKIVKKKFKHTLKSHANSYICYMEKKYIFELEMKVRDYEVDAEGIVNNARYLHYMEHTRHEFCEWAGMTFRDMCSRGIFPVLNKVTIEYKVPLGLGERFKSCLNIARKGPRFMFYQDIYNMKGDLVAKAEVSCVTMVDGRLTRGDEIAHCFEKFL